MLLTLKTNPAAAGFYFGTTRWGLQGRGKHQDTMTRNKPYKPAHEPTYPNAHSQFLLAMLVTIPHVVIASVIGIPIMGIANANPE